MNQDSGPGAEPAPDAEGDLSRVQARVDAARALLARLLQEVVAAQALLSNSPSARLLEANEQLVLTALRNQADAAHAAQLLAKVSRSAELDDLTQLPNRALLLGRFEQAIANARRHGQRLALLFLDLDNFKQVNDTLGHAAGDEVLKVMAHRLVSAVRDADSVARLGGDEFVVLLSEVGQVADAAHIADKLGAALAAPSRIGDRVLRLRASIGIALYPDHGADAPTLLAHADAAMYEAKRKGLHSAVFLDPQAQALRDPVAHLPDVVKEQRRHQDELREANERLVLSALSAREMQAAAERAQLQQADFMRLAAQELGNPLAPIRLAAAMLGQLPADEAVLQRSKLIIDQQVEAMTRLVDAVASMSQAARPAFTVDRQRVDLVAVVAAAAARARPAMDARLQTFTVHGPAAPLVVLGDAARLEQVATNLLDNASQHTPDLGKIRLVLGVRDQHAELSVSDTGIGITPLALPTLFEPFAGDLPALGLRPGGPGVGLAVVRTLVAAHGGTVVAESAGTGRGSRFTVTLPLAPPEPAPDRAGSSPAA